MGESPNNTGATEQTAELWLPPGRHNIAVKAETETSVGLSDSIEVTRRSADGQPKPKLNIVAIGGGSDAATLASSMTAAAPQDFEAPRARVLQGKDASPEAIVAELERLRKDSTLADTTFIYVAGGVARPRRPISAFHHRRRTGRTLGQRLGALLAPIPGRIVLATDLKRSDQKSNAIVRKTSAATMLPRSKIASTRLPRISIGSCSPRTTA